MGAQQIHIGGGPTYSRPSGSGGGVEMCLIGSIVYDEGALESVSLAVEAGDFESKHARAAFAACLEMREAGLAIGAESLIAYMGSGNGPLTDYINSAWLEGTSLPGMVATYAAQVAQQSHARRILSTCGEMPRVFREHDTPAAALEDMIGRLTRLIKDAGTGGGITIADAAAGALESAEAAYRARIDGEPPPMSGLSTGFKNLDAILRGLRGETLTILAARPGMGKSAMALDVAMAVGALGGGEVAFFSYEMSGAELGERALSNRARVDSHNISRGNLRGDDFSRLAGAARYLRDCRVTIYNEPTHYTAPRVLAEWRRLSVSPRGLSMVVVDYLQIRPTERRNGGNREQEIAELGRSLKLMAGELGVPVIALSQLNRGCEQRTNRRPRISDLRESGALEQDANNVLFMYREDYYRESGDRPDGLAECIVAKHRGGPTGTAILEWQGPFTRFEDSNVERGYDR